MSYSHVHLINKVTCEDTELNMNNYFSNLISSIGGHRLAVPSFIPAEDVVVPKISYITLYNPSLVEAKAESFEQLSKQIMFFISSTTSEVDEESKAHEHLSIVGLLRGSCSLAEEFGKESNKPITVLITGGTVTIVEIDPGYFLACSMALPQKSERHDVMVKQITSLIARAQRNFNLLNPPFSKMLKIHGIESFSEVLREYWTDFMGNFNDALNLQWAPKLLAWPNCMNYTGVFDFLPDHNYKKSSIRVPDSLRTDLEDTINNIEVRPSGILVANFNKSVPKRYGLIYMNSKLATEDDSLSNDSMADIYNMLEFYDYHDELTHERLGKRRPLSQFFAQMESVTPPSEVDTEEELTQTPFSLNPAAAFEMLHPANITNTLVVLPLSSTVNGIKYLGLAVNDQIPLAPSWMLFQRPKEPTEAIAEEPEVQEDEEVGHFAVGLEGEDISRLLVYILTSSTKPEVREHLLVVYVQEGIVIAYVFDSSIEQLSQAAFYNKLKESSELVLDTVSESMNISSGPHLGSSILSLPNPISTMVRLEYNSVDSEFFFIVYDTKEHYYQSSLPFLPVTKAVEKDEAVAKLTQRFHNALFHLHDQITDHFVMRSQMFLNNVSEHLHKFSSNKTNAWLFYFIRHKHKAIIIIRNYNSKHKPEKKEVDAGYLHQIADSVYDYAHLGFLDNLGDDVKVWLEGLGRKDET